MRSAFNTTLTARLRRLPLVALAASLLAACATGEQQDPDAPWDDDAGELVGDARSLPDDTGDPEDAGLPPDDTGEPTPDAGYPEDAGFPAVDVPPPRDVPAVDVPPPPMDVPVVRDVPATADVPSMPVDVPVARDVPVNPDVPPTCTGPTTQTCSTCGTQSRTCVSGTWSAWSTCALPTLSIAGNWRFGIAPSGSTTTALGLGWFAAGSSATAFTGAMVDGYGYAEFNPIAVDVCTRRVTFTKRYLYGTSTNLSFRYVGTHTAGTPRDRIAGTWVDVSDATNTSVFAAQTSTGRTPASFSGSWRLTSSFSITSTNLTVTASGGLTGTMVDTYGTSSLHGAVDFESGYLMFIKRYTSGSSTGQQYLYGGTVNASNAVVGGTWSYQGTPTNEGTWSATR